MRRKEIFKLEKLEIAWEIRQRKKLEKENSKE